MRKARWTALALTAALAASMLVASSPVGAITKKKSPQGSLMMVTANLEEAWDYRDTQSHWDMDKFVQRVLDDKYVPDVLAVQEVRKSSAKYVARKLSSRSGDPFRVVVMPPDNPFQPYKGRAGAYETSIIANTATMRILNKGGYMPTAAKPEHVVEPNDPVFFQAFGLLQKKSSGEKFAVMSVHTYPRGYLANMDLDKYYRGKWATQMRKKLSNRYGSKKTKYILAGDFNQSVCLRGNNGDCFTPSPFATDLKRAGYDNTADSQGPVDLIWSKGKSGALHGWDLGHAKMSAKYSDHPYRWSVLGRDTYPPTKPSPTTVKLSKTQVTFTWTKPDDRGGVGIQRLQLERNIEGRGWVKIQPNGRAWHKDSKQGDLGGGDRVRYRIRAIDLNGNEGPYATSREMKVN